MENIIRKCNIEIDYVRKELITYLKKDHNA